MNNISPIFTDDKQGNEMMIVGMVLTAIAERTLVIAYTFVCVTFQKPEVYACLQ